MIFPNSSLVGGNFSIERNNYHIFHNLFPCIYFSFVFLRYEKLTVCFDLKTLKKHKKYDKKKKVRSICKRRVRFHEEYVTSVISTWLHANSLPIRERAGLIPSPPLESILMEGGCWP